MGSPARNLARSEEIDPTFGAAWPVVFGSCQDRVQISDSELWRINPRNGFLEARIPFTWVGVRIYRGVLGRDAVRVLHRPQQVQAPSFARTLHRLPVTAGHPSEGGRDVDITPANAAKFSIGSTGDSITFDAMPVLDVSDPRQPKALGEAKVPTGLISVRDEHAIRKITDPEDPHTATSLGYLPLWASPPSEEIVGELDGHPVAVWQSPWGPIEFDIEHVLDAEDPRVLALAEEEPSFNRSIIGANHAAAVLRSGSGRGDAAAELLRLVDCRDAKGSPLFVFPPDRPASQREPMTTDKPQTQTVYRVDFGLTPVTDAKLKKLGLERFSVPLRAIDMPNEEMAAKLKEMSMALMAMAEALMGATEEKEAAEGERDAMATVAEEAKQGLMQAEEKATDLASQLAAAEKELAPLRARAIADAKRKAALLLGAEANDKGELELPPAVRDAKDLKEIQRAAFDAAHPDPGERSDDYIAGWFAAAKPKIEGAAVQDRLQLGANDSVNPLGRGVVSGPIAAKPKTKSSHEEEIEAALGWLG